MERGRDEEDRKDDVIKVEAIPLDRLDGEWHRQEIAGGEILLIQVEKGGS